MSKADDGGLREKFLVRCRSATTKIFVVFAPVFRVDPSLKILDLRDLLHAVSRFHSVTKLLHREDEARLQRGAELFDELLAYFARKRD